MMRPLIILFLFLAGGFVSLQAQPPHRGELRVRVAEKTGAAQLPVKNALVELLLKDVPVDSAMTDSTGHVRISALAGKYTIRVSAPGYLKRVIGGIIISPDKTTYITMPPVFLEADDFATPDGKPATLRIKTMLSMESTEQALGAVSITITSKQNPRMVVTQISGKRGTAGFALKPGTYLVTVEKYGFEREEGISGNEDGIRVTTSPVVIHIPRKGTVDFKIYMRLVLPKTKEVRLVPVED